MRRHNVLRSLGVAVAAATLVENAGSQTDAAGASRPNILLIFSDQQHWQALGFMDPFFETPSLDRHIKWGDELYDLKEDPHELENLADDPEYAAVMSDLAGKLDEWMKDHKDPFYSLEVSARSGGKVNE